MILGIDIVKNLGLIENLCERELNNPEGAGFDVRAKEIFRIKSDGFLGTEERKTSESEVIAKYGKDKEYVLKPNEYILIKTIEKVNVPENIVMLTFPRSSLQRCGVLLLATQADPGYSGELIFGLKNLSNNSFRLELGARIAKVLFFEIKGRTTNYRGQWQGGRVSTENIEKQV